MTLFVGRANVGFLSWLSVDLVLDRSNRSLSRWGFFFFLKSETISTFSFVGVVLSASPRERAVLSTPTKNLASMILSGRGRAG